MQLLHIFILDVHLYIFEKKIKKYISGPRNIFTPLAEAPRPSATGLFPLKIKKMIILILRVYQKLNYILNYIRNKSELGAEREREG